MKIRNVDGKGIKIYLKEGNKEIARAYLYILKNNLHNEPFGLLEDVYVDESLRGRGIGANLVKEIIKIAKEKKCYKLIATSRYSRPKVHELYKRLGFKEWGKEFRINL